MKFKKSLASAVAAVLGLQPVLASVPTSQLTYNSADQLSKLVLPNGQTFNYGYDLAYQVTTYQQPSAYSTGAGSSVVYGYNGRGSLTSLTDPRSFVTGYSVDGFGGVGQRNSPDTGITSYLRNAAGQVTARTNANGNGTASLTYDLQGRMTAVNYGDQQVSFNYDESTSGVGKLTSMVDGSGSTAWQYDLLGRVTSKSQNVSATAGGPGGATLALQYTYLPGGRVSTMTYPSGAVVSYSYSGDDVVSIALNGVNIVSNVAYDAADRVTTWGMGGAGNYQRVFDTYGRITSYSYATGTRQLTWDDSSRLTSQTNPDGTIWTYAYDNLDRLRQAFEMGYGTKSYAFDVNGNMLTESNPSGVAYGYAYLPGSNRLAPLTQPTRTRSYTWDGAGNMLTNGLTSAGPFTMIWNNAGQLAQVTGGQQTPTMVYNGLGQRVKKHAQTGAGCTATVEHFFYAEDGVSMLGDYRQSVSSGCSAGALTTVSELVYLHGMPVALLRNNTVYYLLPDHLGTTRTIKDTTGANVWLWPSDAFGRVAPNGNPSGQQGQTAFVFQHRFPGQYFDQETGMVYNNARYYDAETGRYYSSDRIGLAGGINTYTYSGNSPLNYIDPAGLDNPRMGLYSPAWDLGAVVAKLNQQALPNYNSQCALYVRIGLAAGGADFTKRPLRAKDYAASLVREGFDGMGTDSPELQAGDVAVWPEVPGHRSGHIQVYNGFKWVSDTRQKNFYPEIAFRAAKPEYFRNKQQ